MEGSHSGLVHHLGKVAYLNGYQEFKSLTLRQQFLVSVDSRAYIYSHSLKLVQISYTSMGQRFELLVVIR